MFPLQLMAPTKIHPLSFYEFGPVTRILLFPLHEEMINIEDSLTSIGSPSTL